MALLCCKGAESVVSFMLDVGVPVDRADRGTPPFHFATTRGCTEIMRMLLARGARFDTCDEAGNQPLHNAAIHAKVDAVQLLIDLGADPSVKNRDGWTPFDLAAGHAPRPWWARECAEHGLTMEVLFNAIGEPKLGVWDKLTIAVRCGRAALVAEAIAADPGRASDPWLLELALTHAHESVVRTLIDAGVTVTDDALACSSSSAVLELALQAMCRTKRNLPEPSSNTFHRAIDEFSLDSVVLLLAAGAKPTINDARRAAQLSQYKTMIALLAAGLVVNNWTPILDTVGSCMEFVSIPPEGEAAAYAAEAKKWRDINDDVAAIDDAKLKINAARLKLLRPRLLDICTALHSLELDALCMTTIVLASMDSLSDLPFHKIWNIVTAAKHFRSSQAK